MHARSFLYVALGAACLLSLGARAEEGESLKPKPDAALTLEATSVAAGVGWAWGGGKLSYKGKTHAVTVDGLTAGSVGVSSIKAVGTVYYLKKLEDFEGTYTAAVVGSTVGGGAGWLVMRNQVGVEVRMRAATQGVSLTAGTSGVKLALQK